MLDKRLIHGRQPQVLHLALCQQEPVKWIARLRFGIGRDDYMAGLNWQNGKPHDFEIPHDIVKLHTGVQLSKPCFDGHFPQARDAYKTNGRRIGKTARDSGILLCKSPLKERQRDVRIEKDSHQACDRGRRRKSSGSGSSKSSAMNGTGCLIPFERR